jgi:hypothetical protein
LEEKNAVWRKEKDVYFITPQVPIWQTCLIFSAIFFFRLKISDRQRRKKLLELAKFINLTFKSAHYLGCADEC